MENIGFFGGNFRSLLKKYLNETIRDFEGNNVTELLERFNELSNHIDKTVRHENITFDQVKVVKKENADE